MPPASASNTCGLSVKPKQRLSSKTALLTIHSASITRRLLHQSNFYTRKLLEQRLSTPYINLDTSHLFHPTPLTLDTFYTRHLLHPAPFTPKRLLRQTSFTTNNFYTCHLLRQTNQTSFTPKKLLHSSPFTPGTFDTRHFLHQTLFTPNNFCTRNLLRQTPFTQETFYTRHLFPKHF